MVPLKVPSAATGNLKVPVRALPLEVRVTSAVSVSDVSVSTVIPVPLTNTAVPGAADVGNNVRALGVREKPAAVDFPITVPSVALMLYASLTREADASNGSNTVVRLQLPALSMVMMAELREAPPLPVTALAAMVPPLVKLEPVIVTDWPMDAVAGLTVSVFWLLVTSRVNVADFVPSVTVIL